MARARHCVLVRSERCPLIGSVRMHARLRREFGVSAIARLYANTLDWLWRLMYWCWWVCCAGHGVASAVSRASVRPIAGRSVGLLQDVTGEDLLDQLGRNLLRLGGEARRRALHCAENELRRVLRV